MWKWARSSTIVHFLHGEVPQDGVRIIFSTITEYSFATYKVIIFSLKACWLNIREVRGGEVQDHWGGNSCAFGIGFSPLPPTRNYHHPPSLPTQSLQPLNFLPIGPRTSPLLTSLMLSHQTYRLKIISFLAESCGCELIVHGGHQWFCNSRNISVNI